MTKGDNHVWAVVILLLVDSMLPLSSAVNLDDCPMLELTIAKTELVVPHPEAITIKTWFVTYTNHDPHQLLSGEACILDIPSADANYEIQPDDIINAERSSRLKLHQHCIVLLRTHNTLPSLSVKANAVEVEGGRENETGVVQYGNEPRWPGFSADAIEWLLHERRVTTVGTDSSTIDAGNVDGADPFSATQKCIRNGIRMLLNVAPLYKQLVPLNRGGSLLIVPRPFDENSTSDRRRRDYEIVAKKTASVVPSAVRRISSRVFLYGHRTIHDPCAYRQQTHVRRRGRGSAQSTGSAVMIICFALLCSFGQRE